MNLKQTKRLLAALGIAAILVGVIAAQFNPTAAILLAVVPLAAFLVVQLKFWHCPHCGGYLGRFDEKRSFCQHCGKKLDGLE